MARAASLPWILKSRDAAAQIKQRESRRTYVDTKIMSNEPSYEDYVERYDKVHIPAYTAYTTRKSIQMITGNIGMCVDE